MQLDVNLLSGVCKMSLTRTEQIYQNYSEKVVKRPRSYRLTQKSSINLPINELYNYLANVDKLILSPSNVFDHFLLIYNSSGQLVLKVFKSNKIFLLKDLHDNALWTIQITKNWWALRPTETHVSRFTCKACKMLSNGDKKYYSNFFQVQDMLKGFLLDKVTILMNV